MSPDTILACPHCRGGLKIITPFPPAATPAPLFSLAVCACGSYPIVDGVLYLKKDARASSAKRAIALGDRYAAYMALAGGPRRITVPLYLLTRYAMRRMGKGARPGAWLSLERVVRLLAWLGYDRNWALYLIGRTRNPTFLISSFVTSFIRDTHAAVVDLGCGTGQLLRMIRVSFPSAVLIGIDRSFTTLLLARCFSVQSDIVLVCADLERGVPIRSGRARYVLVNDTLHDIRAYRPLIREIRRILVRNGVLIGAHIVNAGQSLEHGQGISHRRVAHELNTAGNACFKTDSALWKNLQDGNPVSLRRSDNERHLRNAHAYTVFWSPSRLPARISP